MASLAWSFIWLKFWDEDKAFETGELNSQASSNSYKFQESLQELLPGSITAPDESLFNMIIKVWVQHLNGLSNTFRSFHNAKLLTESAKFGLNFSLRSFKFIYILFLILYWIE